MMEKLNFDTGVKRYRLNGGGVLAFNPGDPNLYARFMEAVEKMEQMEKTMLASGEQDALQTMCQADKELKQLLGWVFGPENDFDSLLGGVNLLAVVDNGERVVTNLLQALMPVLTQGAQRCAGTLAEEAVAKAKRRRESQC